MNQVKSTQDHKNFVRDKQIDEKERSLSTSHINRNACYKINNLTLSTITSKI